MPEIIRQNIRSFDLQNRVKVLRTASRFRRVPRHVRPAIRRRVGRKFANWQDSEFYTHLEALNMPADKPPIASDGNESTPGAKIKEGLAIVSQPTNRRLYRAGMFWRVTRRVKMGAMGRIRMAITRPSVKQKAIAIADRSTNRQLSEALACESG